MATADFSAALQAKLGGLPTVPSVPNISASQVRSALPPNLQATWDSHVAEYNASAAEQAGAQAALTLANGHFSNAAIVHAFSGAVAAVPGVGPIMAGLTEFFYANGSAIGDAFGNLFGLDHCNVDDRSPATWLSGAHITPASNSFASVAAPMLALAWSDYVACREGQSGIPWRPCSQIIPAAVGAWNAIATGPSIDYFVPAIRSSECPFLELGQWAIHNDTGFLITSNQGPYAFVPLSQVPSSMLGGENQWWARVQAKAGPVATTATSPTSPSGGATVAGHAGSIAAGAVVGGLLYAWATGEAVKPVFEGALRILQVWVKQAGDEVRRLG